MVLGIPWFKKLCVIACNFEESQMQLSINNTKFILKGLQAGNVKLSHQPTKSLLNSHTILMSTKTIPTPTLEKPNTALHPGLIALLKQFFHMFDEPKTLPHVRRYDHKIPLSNENQTFKRRPYKYPMIQKNEIERMVAEMQSSSKKKMVLGDFVLITGN